MEQKPTTSQTPIVENSDSLVLTPVETANLLRMCRTTVYEQIRQGAIPSVRIGKRILVPRAALMRKLEEANRKEE